MKRSTLNSVNIKRIVLAMALMMFLLNTQAQNNGIYVGANYRSSGNGLGSTFSPQIGYRKKSQEIVIGTNIQKRHLNMTGLNLRYNYNLGRVNNTEFFLFCSMSYFNNAYLGKNNVAIESHVRPEYASFYNGYRMKVMSEHAGFGIRLVRSEVINCFALIGAGAYQTLGCYQKELFRLRDRAGSSLLIGIGVNVKLYAGHK
jgi:hypothetical protein